jgi:hypothetical protein
VPARHARRSPGILGPTRAAEPAAHPLLLRRIAELELAQKAGHHLLKGHSIIQRFTLFSSLSTSTKRTRITSVLLSPLWHLFLAENQVFVEPELRFLSAFCAAEPGYRHSHRWSARTFTISTSPASIRRIGTGQEAASGYRIARRALRIAIQNGVRNRDVFRGPHSTDAHD